MHMAAGAPLQGKALEQLNQFLHASGLRYDPNITYTVCLWDEDRIAATGSLDGNTIKCIAVDPLYQGEDLTSQIMTALMQESMRRGIRRLMLYTKPVNQAVFASFGFHPVIRTASCLIMENRRNGLEEFLSALPPATQSGSPIGCVVAHCNPFTLGHRYLIEKAAAECAFVYVFILSENKGMFSPDARLQMAKDGLSHLANVHVASGGPYMVSSATFPTYFIRDEEKAAQVYCEADLLLFGKKIAPALGITRRYVGTEPLSPVTKRYNEEMKKLLPPLHVEVAEVERLTSCDTPVSASLVRKALERNDLDMLRRLLPESSLQYILNTEGGRLCPIPTECRKT